jgi:hypothetical protein
MSLSWLISPVSPPRAVCSLKGHEHYVILARRVAPAITVTWCLRAALGPAIRAVPIAESVATVIQWVRLGGDGGVV